MDLRHVETIFCLRANRQFSLFFVIIATHHRHFLTAIIMDGVVWWAASSKVQGHCTLVHDLFHKNSHWKPFHIFSCFFFYFPNSRITMRDADANGFFAFMRVVRSPPLLLTTFYSATRSVPWLPWLPSPDPSRSTTARHPHMVRYGDEEKSSIRASRRKANCATSLGQIFQTSRFDAVERAAKSKDIRSDKKIGNNKN